LNPEALPLGEFQSDATVFYVNDSIQLAKRSRSGRPYVFWAPVNGKLQGVPILTTSSATTPTRARASCPARSARRASPRSTRPWSRNTKAGYLFFLAKHDGSDTTAFAKTQAEHLKNIQKYGAN
jgi:hypothetical protein